MLGVGAGVAQTFVRLKNFVEALFFACDSLSTLFFSSGALRFEFFLYCLPFCVLGGLLSVFRCNFCSRLAV